MYVFCVCLWYLLDTGVEEGVVAEGDTIREQDDMDNVEDPVWGKYEFVRPGVQKVVLVFSIFR